MHRWMHNAAGGTIQRLKPGLATEWLRSRIDKTPICRLTPLFLSARIAYPRGIGNASADFFPIGSSYDPPEHSHRFPRTVQRFSGATFTFPSCRVVIEWRKRAKEISCPPHSTLDSGQPP